jgi:Putative transposase
VHFHVLVLDGVFTRDPQGRVLFHPAPPPNGADLSAIVERTQRRALAWLRRRGYLGDPSPENGSDEPTVLDACAAIATGRGQVVTLARPGAADAADEDHKQPPEGAVAALERQGFNLHAGVCIEAGDDLGCERLARYALRPPLSLERLRRLPGGRIAYRLKYVSRGRGKHRVMTGMEFMARLAAIIAPPRYPLVRYGGCWRRDPSGGATSCPDLARSARPARRHATGSPRRVPLQLGRSRWLQAGLASPPGRCTHR